jgi:hypothetical protein
VSTLRLTIVVDYEADPAHYGTDDVAVMAAIDQRSVDDGDLRVEDLMETGSVVGRVILPSPIMPAT